MKNAVDVLARRQSISSRVELGAGAESERSRSQILHFFSGAERSRSDNIFKKLGAGSEPESDFKVVF